MLLRARIVLPVSAPLIEDGAVLLSDQRIRAVGRWNELRNERRNRVVDLGESILLPGLINAHCHLDYTDMAGKLKPAKNFSDWIKAIVSLKAEWSYADFALSWLNGAKMLLRSGTTTVVDIEAVPELLPEVLECTPLRVIPCLELLSIRGTRSARQMVDTAVEKIYSLKLEAAGLSPHAPYSTVPALLRAAANAANRNGWLITTHVAESADEFHMFRQARGAMFNWLRPQRDMSDCGAGSPVAHLSKHELLGRNFLAAHANYLADGDAELLGRSNSSVVHCPRSHAFFRHQDFPIAELERAGVGISLGTDSLATTLKARSEPLALNMFSEMRTFAKSFPELSAERVLGAATVRAAQAINREGELGTLAPNASADLIAVPSAGKAKDAVESVLHHRGDVLASMIRGQWALEPPHS